MMMWGKHVDGEGEERRGRDGETTPPFWCFGLWMGGGASKHCLKDAELRFGTGLRNQIQSVPVLGGDVTSRMWGNGVL